MDKIEARAIVKRISWVIIFLRLILESNEERKEEIKDENGRRQVEKIKKRVEALERRGESLSV